MMKQTATLKEIINHNYYRDLLFINVVALVAASLIPDCCPIWANQCILKY